MIQDELTKLAEEEDDEEDDEVEPVKDGKQASRPGVQVWSADEKFIIKSSSIGGYYWVIIAVITSFWFKLFRSVVLFSHDWVQPAVIFR